MQILTTTVYSLGAAIVGALIVHWLTRSRERANWLRDTRIKEWRELLETLTTAYMELLKTSSDIRMSEILLDNAKKHEVLADVDIVLSTRIFIVDDLESLNARKIWVTCVDGYRATHDRSAFKAHFHALRVSMVELARKTK